MNLIQGVRSVMCRRWRWRYVRKRRFDGQIFKERAGLGGESATDGKEAASKAGGTAEAAEAKLTKVLEELAVEAGFSEHPYYDTKDVNGQRGR